MTEMTITKTIFLRGSPERVWRFLTKKELLATWFHEGREDLAEGGAFCVLTNSEGKEGTPLCTGQVLEFVPPADGRDGRLVHTFTHDWLNGAVTTCDWTLTGVEGGTILTLVHSGFEKVGEEAFTAGREHDKGWDEHFVRLRMVVA